MKVNIITSSKECIDFLLFFQLRGDHSLHVEFEKPIPNSSPPSDTDNDYNWTSWLRMGSYSHIKDYYSSDLDFDEKHFKSNIFQMHTFLSKYENITYEEFKALFFYKTGNGQYVTTSITDYKMTLQKLNITENDWWLSIGVYCSDDTTEQNLTEDCFQNSYDQLKIFYSSFIEKFDKSQLFLLPHFNNDAYWKREELEGRVYPDVSYDDHEDSDDWAELGREEEHRMDEETDGFWRLNTD